MPASQCVRRACLASGLLLFCIGMPLHAQTPQPSAQPSATAAEDKVINNVISEAVQGGETPYRPLTPAQTRASQSLDVECRQLADQIANTSRQRRYESTGPAIENAQGRTSPSLERDNTRKQLERAYRDKCTQ